MGRYSVVLVPDSGSYMILVPSLPGCVTFGDSVEEALAMAREAVALHIEGLAAAGEPIPEDEGEPILAAIELDPKPTERS